MATLGFVAIVKNEAAIIRRALDSVRDLVDYVLISDTGSTDGTQGVVREWLAENGLPGEVIERPWKNFAASRNDSIKALRAVSHIDYALSIDADEYLVLEPGFDIAAFKQSLPQADVYSIMCHFGTYRFRRLQLFSNRIEAEYRGVIHATLAAPGARHAALHGMYVESTTEGARNRDPRKFAHNAELLEKALETETDPRTIARHVFYLAQSYRDAGEPEKALENFLRRAGMGFWSEEVALCFTYAANIMEAQERLPHEATIATYIRSFETNPARAEPLLGAARVARKAQSYQHAFLLARAGIDIPEPDGLFVDASVYAWRMLDEYQIAAYWAGRYPESVAASERLLAEARFPPHERARIEANAGFARGKIPTVP